MSITGRERVIIAMLTIVSASCSIFNYLGETDVWITAVLMGAVAFFWWLHLAQKAGFPFRAFLYFIYGMFLCYYLGTHDADFFDISVNMLIFMVTFQLLDQIFVMNAILVLYAFLVLIRMYLVYRGTVDMPDEKAMVWVILYLSVVIFTDVMCKVMIRERIRAAGDNERWKEKVSVSNHAAEDFVENIVRGMSGPVAAVNEAMKTFSGTEEGREAEVLRAAGIRLSKQLSDIRDYTSLKAGEVTVSEKNYEITSLMDTLAEEFRNTENSKKLQLIIDLEPETPTVLSGDADKIGKIIRNLLENAMKYTEEGGIYLHVFAKKQTYGTNLMIEVADTGIGMTRSELALMTNGKYKPDREWIEGESGFGIGLLIVYGFAHLMGGFVKIDSKKGSGTTVRVTIPQKTVDPTPCLALTGEITGEQIFFTKPEKFHIPELREFNLALAVHLARGLNKRLYSANDKRELRQLLRELNVTHIFTAQEEYESEGDLFDRFGAEGCQVVVYGDRGFRLHEGSNAILLEKPVHGGPLVKILNGNTNPSTGMDS